jgi:hypothetical protein
MMRGDHTAVRHEPDMKTRRRFGSIHDKSVRKSASAPPRLFTLRDAIHLRPDRFVLVRGGNRKAADAGRRRGLPVPGLLAEDDDANLGQRGRLKGRPRRIAN